MEKRDKLRRPLAALAVAACLLLAAGGTTLAYFTDSETAHNVVTSGGVDIGIVEKTKVGDDLLDFPEEGVFGVMPGESVSKIVTVENTGSAPAWVRVKVDRSVLGKDKAELPLTAEVKVGNADGSDEIAKVEVVSFEVKDGWIDGEDGWWYWTSPVAPGGSTGVLLDAVSFAKLTPNTYQGCTASVDVSAQAVQSAHNGGTVLEAAGWPSEAASGSEGGDE